MQIQSGRSFCQRVVFFFSGALKMTNSAIYFSMIKNKFNMNSKPQTFITPKLLDLVTYCLSFPGKMDLKNSIKMSKSGFSW